MTESNPPKFAIVGAGLAGALMAIYLGKAGYDVDVYEKRPDLRKQDAGPSRSINLAISARAIHALQQVGLAQGVLDEALPMRGRMLHAPSGELTFQPYSKNPTEAIHSVSRSRLNEIMLDAAERHPHVRLHFQHRCTDFDPDSKSITLQNEAGNISEVKPDVTIGSDGAFSIIRARMMRLDRFDYEQSYLEHGYKELTIPPDHQGRHRMDPNALHIWPRRAYMMIALPNRDGSFTCTLFWPFDGPVSFNALQTPEQIRRCFSDHFADAVPLIPDLVQGFQGNPVGSLVTIRCRPWYIDQHAVLIGDAAHAVVPFYGQGINAGFEDCFMLSQCLAEHRPDRARAFDAYYRSRKRQTDALADLAIENFVEMRDHAGSPAFLRRKKRERFLHAVYPGYVPLYSMVSFSLTPYADAVTAAANQKRRVSQTLWAIAVMFVAMAAILAWVLLRSP